MRCPNPNPYRLCRRSKAGCCAGGGLNTSWRRDAAGGAAGTGSNKEVSEEAAAGEVKKGVGKGKGNTVVPAESVEPASQNKRSLEQ